MHWFHLINMPLRHLLNSQKLRILQHEIHRYKSTSSHHLSTIEFLLVPWYHAKGILCFFHADGIPEKPCLVYTLICFSAHRNINAQFNNIFMAALFNNIFRASPCFSSIFLYFGSTFSYYIFQGIAFYWCDFSHIDHFGLEDVDKIYLSISLTHTSRCTLLNTCDVL